MKIPLTGSVGNGGDNARGEVIAVKQRMIALGFEGYYLDPFVDAGFVAAIRLFQAVIHAKQAIGDFKGLIQPKSDEHAWLEAANAPQWRMLPRGGRQLGYVNIEVRDQMNDGHDFGTDWLMNTIRAAGQNYVRDFLSKDGNAGKAVINVNDASLVHGGDTPDHKGHEAGLCVDLRLPRRTVRKDGTVAGGMKSSEDADFDRDAARATLKAFLATPLAVTAFFNDQTLIDEKLCSYLRGHDDHIHVQINRAPALLAEDAALDGRLNGLSPELVVRLRALAEYLGDKKVIVEIGRRFGPRSASPFNSGIASEVSVPGLTTIAIADALVTVGFTGVGELYESDGKESATAQGDIRGLAGSEDSGPFGPGGKKSVPACWYRVGPEGSPVVFGRRKSGGDCPKT